MKRLLVALLSIFLTLALFISGTGCGGDDGPPASPTTQYIAMGGTLPLTGIGAYLGIPVQRTVDLIIEEFNEAGGIVINGVTYLIDMTWYDDYYDPVKGKSNVEKLIYEDEVDYLVGLFGSTFAASSSVLAENEVLVTTTSTGGEEIISPERPYVFRPYSGATVGAYSIMKWLIDNYGIERFAMLTYETKSSIDIAEFYIKVCDDLGVETSVIYYPPLTADYYSMLTKLLADNPDLLFVGPDPLKQARQLGYTDMATGMLTSTNVSVVVGTAGMEDAEGYFMAQNIDWNATPEAIDFHDRFVAKYDEYDDQALSFVGLIEVIIQGIQEAQSTDPTEVMMALDQMAEDDEPIHLPIGDAYWGGAQRYGGVKHQLLMPIHLMDIHNGEPRLIEVLPPPSDEEIVPFD